MHQHRPSSEVILFHCRPKYGWDALDDEWELVFDNGSGTYSPSAKLLNNLKDLLADALDFIGDGVYRENAEVLVPQHIFKSVQFQNWYQPQKAIGNKLEDFEFLYDFYMYIFLLLNPNFD